MKTFILEKREKIEVLLFVLELFDKINQENKRNHFL